MVLTGKAKLDFEKWLNKEMYYLGRRNFEDIYNNIEDLSYIFQNALIVEWFDSVGIYITSDYSELNKGFYSEILDSNFAIIKPTRQEALTEAIKKANEYYNL